MSSAAPKVDENTPDAEFAALSTDENAAFPQLDQQSASSLGAEYKPELPPDGAVEQLKAELADELAKPECASMLKMYGSEPRCFERFLIARQNDVANAAKMFRDTAEWRRTYKLHEGTAFACDAKRFATMQPHWPGAFAGFTCDGSPVNYFRFGELSPKQLIASDPEPELVFTGYYIQWMESTLECQNKANPPGTPSSKWKGMVEVYDFNGLSISQLYVPGILMLGRVLGIGQNHYPENGRKIIMVNVPRIMSASWALVSPVLHENTLAKIEMIRDDGNARLTEVLGGQDKVDAMRATVKVAEKQSWSEWALSGWS